MKEMQLHDYQVGKASSGAWAPDYAARIEFCRSKIREIKHLNMETLTWKIHKEHLIK